MHIELAYYLVKKFQAGSRQQDRLSPLCSVLPLYPDEAGPGILFNAEKLLLFIEMTQSCASHAIGTVCALPILSGNCSAHTNTGSHMMRRRVT
jgi:hypothetical protein